MLITEREDDHIFIREHYAQPNESGWHSGYRYDPDGCDTEVEFFDADSNGLYPVSPIGDLEDMLFQIDDEIRLNRGDW